MAETNQDISRLYSITTSGQTSDTVKQLQQSLIGSGFAIQAGATGYYGPQTQSAIDLWKKSIGNTTGNSIPQTTVSPPTIVADQLNAPTTAAILPTPKQDTTNYASLYSYQPYVPPTPTTTEIPDYLKKYLDTPAPASGLETYNQLYSQLGIEEKTKTVNDLNAQIQSINNEVKQAELKLPSEAISAGAIQGRNLDNERNAAIRVLPLQAQLEAEQGNLQSAQDKIKTLFKIQTDDEDRKYQYEKDKRQAVYEYATLREQRQLDAQQQVDDRRYQLYLSNINGLQDLATAALTSGNQSLISQISKINPNDANFQQQLFGIQSQFEKPVEATPITKEPVPVIPFDQFVDEYMTTAKGQQMIRDIENERQQSLTPQARREALSPLIKGLYDQAVIDSQPEFTNTEKLKLEQAGLIQADRQKQLDYLYGKKSIPTSLSDKDMEEFNAWLNK